MGWFSGVRSVLAAVASLAVLAAGVVVATPAAAVAVPATFTVLNTNDSGAGSLRQAIISANATGNSSGASPDIINAAEVSGTITLESNLPAITGAVRVDGPGASSLAVSGANAYKQFAVNGYAVLAVNGLTLSNAGGGAGVYVDMAGTATLTDMVVRDTTTGTFSGGGVLNSQGTLTLLRTTVTGNSAISGGGVNTSGGSTTIIDSTISSNSATLGGALYVNTGSLTVVNSTLSGNTTSSRGAALYLTGSAVAKLTNVTAAGNSSGTGGALDNGSGTLSVKSSIVASQIAGNDCASTVTDEGYNLSSDASCGFSGTSLASTDPNLGALADNGGSTQTMLPATDSAAVNLVPVASCTDQAGSPAAITTDQRGVSRPQGSGCDVGAVEVLTSPLTVDTTADAGVGSLRQALSDAGSGGSGDAASPTEITFDPSVTGTVILASDLPQVLRATTLTGPGTEVLTVDGASSYLPFYVAPGATLRVSGLTLAHGHAQYGGCLGSEGATYVTDMVFDHCTAVVLGGAIGNGNTGTMALLRTTVSNGAAGGTADAGGGGGIVNSGTMTLDHVTVSGNTSDDAGGGLLQFRAAATLEIVDSTISNNAAHGSSGGGGIAVVGGSSSLSRVSITGNSADGGTLGGGGATFFSAGNHSVTDSTISTNTSTMRGGGIYRGFSGRLTLTGSTVSGNSSTLDGGGIGAFGSGAFEATDVNIVNNTSATLGGGISGAGIGTTALTRVTVANNTATTDSGGGMHSSRPTSIDSSTISGNTAGTYGGGLALVVASAMTVANSTVAGNTAGTSGGGAFSDTNLVLEHSTVADNSAASSSDSSGVQIQAGGRLIINASVITHGVGRTGQDCLIYGAVTDKGLSGVDSDGTCGVASTFADPKLGPLQDNGGATFTRALLEGSPLIDVLAADTGPCPSVGIDQRGVARPQHEKCDIGAVEDQWGWIAPSDEQVPYGSLSPKFPVLTATGLASAPGYTKPSCAATSYTPTSPVGSYPATCWGGGAGGWVVEYRPGTLTVVKADQPAPTVTSLAGVAGKATALAATGGLGTGGYSFTLASTGSARCTLGGTPGAQTVTAAASGSCGIQVVRAGDGNHNASPASSVATVVVTSKPSAPRSPVGSPRSRAAVVSWTAPRSTGGAAITGYRVTSTTKVGTSYPYCTASKKQRSCTVKGLVNGRAYSFRVNATNAVGPSLPSAASLSVVAGAPSNPRKLAVTLPAAGRAKVAWTAPQFIGSGSITGYRVRWCKVGRTCAAWVTLPAGARSATATARVKNTNYRVEIQAKNGSGYGPTASKVFKQAK